MSPGVDWGRAENTAKKYILAIHSVIDDWAPGPSWEFILFTGPLLDPVVIFLYLYIY